MKERAARNRQYVRDREVNEYRKQIRSQLMASQSEICSSNQPSQAHEDSRNESSSHGLSVEQVAYALEEYRPTSALSAPEQLTKQKVEDLAGIVSDFEENCMSKLALPLQDLKFIYEVFCLRHQEQPTSKDTTQMVQILAHSFFPSIKALMPDLCQPQSHHTMTTVQQLWFKVNYIFYDHHWKGFDIKGFRNHLLDVFAARKVEFLCEYGLINNLAILEMNKDLLKSLFWGRLYPLSNLGSQTLSILLQDKTVQEWMVFSMISDDLEVDHWDSVDHIRTTLLYIFDSPHEHQPNLLIVVTELLIPFLDKPTFNQVTESVEVKLALRKMDESTYQILHDILGEFYPFEQPEE